MTQTKLKTIQVQKTQLFGSMNLIGSRASTTTMDFSADMVVLWNPSNNDTAIKINTGTVSNDTSVSGPTANGRDQSGAFSDNSWVHFYFIWNGSTLATISSVNAPSSGPVLPTGYTHWCYIGAIRKSTFIVNTYIRGNRFFLEGPIQVLTGGTATSSTSVSVSAAVPPNAYEYDLEVIGDLRDSAIGTQSNILISFVSGGTNVQIITLSTLVADNTKPVKGNNTTIIPNISQTFYYTWSAAVGTRSANIYVASYIMPNGAN